MPLSIVRIKALLKWPSRHLSNFVPVEQTSIRGEHLRYLDGILTGLCTVASCFDGNVYQLREVEIEIPLGHILSII